MRTTCALAALVFTASAAQGKEYPHFHGRSIDPFGYIEWIGTPPPGLKQLESGAKTEDVLLAANQVLGSQRGDDFLYVTVKGTIAGLRLKNLHSTALVLNRICRQRFQKRSIEKMTETEPEIFIAAFYAATVSAYLTLEPSWNYDWWRRHEHTLPELLSFRDRAYRIKPRTANQLYAMAVGEFLSFEIGPCRTRLEDLIRKYPDEPGLRLMYAKSLLIGVSGDGIKSVQTDSAKANAVLEAAHKRWPQNVRIWHALGVRIYLKDPERARNLLTRYLAAKEGAIEPEIQASKRVLARISQ